MAYVDYKCLESLLIEGEDLIATEGIGEKLKGIATKIFEAAKTFISAIIRILSKLINAIKTKLKSIKKITTPTVKLSVSEITSIFQISKNHAALTKGYISEILGASPNVDNMHIYADKLDNNLERFESAVEKFGRKTNNRKCSISADNAEALLSKLTDAKNAYEDANEKLINSINASVSKGKNAAIHGDNESANIYGAVAKIFSSIVNGNNRFINGLTKVSSIIINAEYIYGGTEVINTKLAHD